MIADSSKRVLITGASGFVGRRLIKTLERLGLNFAGQFTLGHHAVAPDWQHINADVTDYEALLKNFAEAKPDIIIHLAAQSSVGSAASQVPTTWRTNLLGALSVAQACAQTVPQAVVLFTSSAEVYGASFRDGVVDETTLPQPQNAYARSKFAAEGALADVLSADNQLIIARAFNHSGAGQDNRFVLPSFAQQIARMEKKLQPATLHVGNLNAARDFLHVDDVCEAYVALLTQVENLPRISTFNISSGHAQSILKFVEGMREAAEIAFEIVVDPSRLRPHDIPVAAGSNQKILTATGWKPKISHAALITEVLDYARSQCKLD